MKKRIISIIVVTAGVVFGASAQSWDIGGTIIEPSAVTAMDMFNWSRTSDGVSTARATAMGGALTSLGGDIASMAINPAGLGMYRQNDVSVTPQLGIARSSTEDVEAFGRNGSTNFSIGSFGVVLKAYEGSGKLVAVNLGFGYSRLADFNYRTSYARYDNRSSIAGVFGPMLEQGGIDYTDINGRLNENFSWWNYDPKYWGAIEGYKCGLVDQVDGKWQPDARFGTDPVVDQYVNMVSKGAIGEYDLSMGMNIANKLYIGASLGMLSLRQRREIYYGEEYWYDSPDDEPAGEMLEGMNYKQTALASGSGVNIKIGVTYRPLEALRLAVAFHTPTWYSVDYKYRSNMVSSVFDKSAGKYVTPDPDAATETWVDSGRDSWSFRSPAKLLVGASYTIGTSAIVSVDYERAWYGNIHTRETPIGDGVFNDFFKEYFKGSNTIRAGVEYKPTSYVALRAGYGLSGSMVKDKSLIFSTPVNYRTQYFAGGVGFVLSNCFYLDLAYRYTQQKYTTSKLFYASSDEADYYSGNYSTDIARHNLIVTVGFRF